VRPDQCGTFGLPADHPDAGTVRNFGVWLEHRGELPPVPYHIPLESPPDLFDAWVITAAHQLALELLMDGTAPHVGQLPRQLATGPAFPRCVCHYVLRFLQLTDSVKGLGFVQCFVIDRTCHHHGEPRRA
jgi:hypothetical protein